MSDTEIIKILVSERKCQIIRKLVTGGMGSIFLAKMNGVAGFAKTVAIKTINPERLADPTVIKLFIDEAKLVSDLVHENIVQVYDLGMQHDIYFIIMEYVEGKSISQILQRLNDLKKVFDNKVACIIGSKIAKALHYAHTKTDVNGNPMNIVHRDVTPGNIMINSYGVVKLADFGIAKALTMTGPDEKKMIMGKLPYMSPEQINAIGTDPRTDVFTLGLVLYEMMTGKRVYDEVKGRKDLIEKMNKYRIIPPKNLNPYISNELEVVIMKCLQINPDDRYQTAQEVQNDLKFILYANGFLNAQDLVIQFLQKIFEPHEICLKH